MIKVANEVPVYERDGKKKIMVPGETIDVLSHWNDRDLIELRVKVNADGEMARIAVLASDLRAAIENATNKGGRY